MFPVSAGERDREKAGPGSPRGGAPDALEPDPSGCGWKVGPQLLLVISFRQTSDDEIIGYCGTLHAFLLFGDGVEVIREAFLESCQLSFVTALLVVQLGLEFSHNVGPEAGKLRFEKSKFAVQFGIEGDS